MELTSKDEYIAYLSKFSREQSLEVAASLLISKDLQIRNLKQAVQCYKGIADLAKNGNKQCTTK
jgi:hypothetical protein